MSSENTALQKSETMSNGELKMEALRLKHLALEHPKGSTERRKILDQAHEYGQLAQAGYGSKR